MDLVHVNLGCDELIQNINTCHLNLHRYHTYKMRYYVQRRNEIL